MNQKERKKKATKSFGATHAHTHTHTPNQNNKPSIGMCKATINLTVVLVLDQCARSCYARHHSLTWVCQRQRARRARRRVAGRGKVLCGEAGETPYRERHQAQCHSRCLSVCLTYACRARHRCDNRRPSGLANLDCRSLHLHAGALNILIRHCRRASRRRSSMYARERESERGASRLSRRGQQLVRISCYN